MILFLVLVCVPVFSLKTKETHLKAVKRILSYLKHTPDLALWYPRGCNFDLVGYANVDYVGFLVDRKSTSGMAHFLGPCLVSQATKKQHSVAMSIAEVEYVAAISCCAQLLWIRQQLKDFCVDTRSIPIVVTIQLQLTLPKTHVDIKGLNILTFVIIF